MPQVNKYLEKKSWTANLGWTTGIAFPISTVMRNIPEIIEAAGGIAVVAENTGLKDGVRKWAQIGIPDRYWSLLLGLAPSLTLEELYAANRKARGTFQPSGKSAA